MFKLRITPEFSEWFGAWIGDGDHSSIRRLALSNQVVELLHLHIKILTEYFNFPRERILAEVTTSSLDDNQIIRDRWSKLLLLPLQNIRTINRNPIARKECARVMANNVEITKFVRNNISTIRKRILNSNNEIMCAYLMGIFAAEGNVRTEKHQKHVRLGMKTIEDIDFAKLLLEKIGIETKLAINTSNDCYELSIFGYENLLKFRDFGGFGKHESKNIILNRQLSTYGKFPWSYRYQCLEAVLRNVNTITNYDAVNIFDMNYHNAKLMLSRFSKQGKLSVDKTNKTYTYKLKEI
ncbi:MAG: LAGLIDADG family homing endonuclease [Nanoarchaeota archaeon]|nr:LAGLIDADG family homing endonuclease [Nanoarchaeota archaeon]MBU4038022.1 LAGLIDADG family homing endonuclease [Pseudomonadota bacterium]MBU4124244.1 LAGLIDADG family homing endonuclease [Nanoarchaeota archaeon]